VAKRPRLPATIDINLPGWHAGQQWVHDNRRRFTWLIAGRRWRKTTFLMREVLTDVLQKGSHILWVAPTYDQVRIGWEECRKGSEGALTYMKSEMVAVSNVNSGKILFRSVDDPNNARGHTADGIVADEIGDIVEEAWYEVMRPIIMDTGGWAILAGTPKGRNFVWREVTRADEDPNVLAVQAPTLGCEITPMGLARKPHPLENPHVPFEELVHLYRTMPERSFRQEILAEFIEDSGTVFRFVRRQATSVIREPYFGTFVIGVDWGRTNDFTVATVMDCQTREVVDFDRFNQIDFYFQQERLAGLWRKWSAGNAACSILAETNSIGRPNLEALQRMGLPIYGWNASNTSKQQLIETLSLDIEQQTIRYPAIPELISELEAYEMVRLPSGLLRYQAPQGMHDDIVTSLALANYGSRAPMLDRLETEFVMEGYDEDDDDEPEIMRALRQQRMRDMKTINPWSPVKRYGSDSPIFIEIYENINAGNLVRGPAVPELYAAEYRRELQSVAALFLKEKQDIKAQIALAEVQRLDEKYDFALA
jgi:hypothetical protein